MSESGKPKLKPTAPAAVIRPFKHFEKARKVWLPEALLWRTELSANAKLVYARLARYESREGEARPKLGSLAVELGLGWFSVQRAVKELIKWKLLTVRLRRGQHRPNLYEFLDHPWLHAEAPPVPEPVSPVQEELDLSADHIEIDDETDADWLKTHVSEGPIGAPPPMYDNVPSDAPAQEQTPIQTCACASLDPSRPAQAHVATCVYAFRDLRIRMSDEESQFEESQSEESQFSAGLSGTARSSASPSVGKLAGEDGSDQIQNQGSAPYQQEKLSNPEDGMNSYERGQLAAAEVAARLRQHEAAKAEKARRAAKKQAASGSKRTEAKVRVRPFELLWRSELERQFPLLDMQTIGRWFSSSEETNDEGESRTVWRGLKEVGIVAKLIKKFNPDLVAKYIVWTIRNWPKLQERFPKSPQYPTVGWLLAMSDALLPEATTTVRGADVKAEVDQWYRDHPGEVELPPDLLARLQAVPKPRR